MVDFALEKSRDLKKGAGVVTDKLESGFVMEILSEKASSFDGDSVDLSTVCDEMEEGVGGQTPKGSIFDPFAPAAEELALAPMKKKVEKVTKYPLRRQLDFESCAENFVCGGGDEDVGEEERILEGLRVELFDFIVATQLEEMSERDPVPVATQLEEMAERDSVPDTGCGCSTPPSVRLSGVAETCPDAPKRARLVVRRNTEGICRKLEFGGDLL